MLEHSQLEVTARSERGKNAARHLRATGKTPATLYGLGQDPESIALDTKLMVRILNQPSGHNRVFDLRGGSKGAAMAVDWQSDPVTGKLLHVDLRRIDLTQTVRVKVAVVTTGVAYGVKTEGGIEDVIVREVEVECLAEDIPEKIECDVTEMKAGQALRVSDLAATDKYAIVSDPGLTLMRIVGKRALEAEAEVGEAEEEAVVAEPAEGEATEEAGGEED